ncbi:MULTISPECIES: oxygen-binding di-iron domain-containing protein [unclassified Desulfurobacterium]|uniref:MBL fold metallo-hydrolase n=1 Tax=Desulfurobacterium sp. TC5-1 TaxID=1158318 RepID=UPI0003B77AF1|nr:MBL fold metallo-hydrolase [Desulfurobacterium sp. TC5-1]
MALKIEEIKKGKIDLTNPVILYESPDYKVAWVGSAEEFIFRCNAYLISSGGINILIDPGGIQHFPQVKDRVTKIVGNPANVTHIITHHQDPDVIGSLPEWLKINPEITVITTPRTKVLIPYYGFDRENVNWLDVSPLDDTIIDIGNSSTLIFLSAPFLHFPDAFVTYDSRSRILFSGDIFAAIQNRWELIVKNMEKHKNEMMYFHVYYMASQKALKYFVNKVSPFNIKAIAPQHGSIIPEEFVKTALDFLSELKCGIDLLYEESPVRSIMDEIFGEN